MISEKTNTTSLSSADLREIVASASTISERLAGGFLVDDTPASEELRQQRFAAWCHISAGGDRERFRRILAWDGYDDMDEVRRFLGHVHVDEQMPLPGWTDILQEMLHLVGTLPGDDGTLEKSSWHFLFPDKPCPFEELLAPFVLVARQRVVRQAGSARDLLADEAHEMLQRHLLQMLTSFSLKTLHTAFLRQRSQELASGGEQPSDEAAAYRRFIAWMYQGGLATFLHTQSFLARLLATTTASWIESSVEFLQRLANDWQDIQRMLGEDPERAQVISIEPALSNPHYGRRSVMALTFASGKKLVYKPRNIGMEVSYSRLLDWCNQYGATPPLQVLATIDRSTYGWMEWVGHEPCRDKEAASRYYRRAGMLLCLIYLLGGVGCSYEHIIASGEHPLLIDPSILLHHYPCPDHQEESEQAQCSDWEQEQFSVLHTGLLATWQVEMDATTWSPGRDISGFVLSNQQNPMGQARLRADSISSTLRHGMLRMRERLNVPVYNASQFSLPERQAALSGGFADLYQLLLRKQSALLAADSPLWLLKEQSVRMVYRPDQAYHSLLEKLLEPEYMYDGVTRSIETEQIYHEPVPVEYKYWREGNSARWRQVFRAEQQALLQGDMPFFTARVDSDIVVADRAIASCLHQASFDLLLKRVEQLSERDLSRQIGLIRQALSPQIAPLPGEVRALTSPDHGPRHDQGLSTDTLLAHARTIADTIAERAIRLEDGTVTWIDPHFLMRSSCLQLQPVRHTLFHGTCGLALFLAASAKILGEPGYHTLARAAVRPLRQSLRADGERLAREMGIGGAIGLGSVVYALTRISGFLEDPTLLESAGEAAHLMRAHHIANDQALDVIAGSAGAILGLLALYEATRDQSILDRAMACGNHLLQTRTMSRANCLAWPTLGQMHTTGFSHGTAGIVYALLRLYAVTGERRLLDAAREGLVYEDRAFVEKRGNWAEILTDEEPEFMATWCHGAPGIGLARIGGLPVLDTAQVRQDVEVALQTTRQIGTGGPDHLCCGSSGRAEMLLTASHKLARPELAEAAQRIIWQIVTKAEQKKGFLLDISLPRQALLLNLFHGSAGIGYTLLRTAYPDLLPSVLLWE